MFSMADTFRGPSSTSRDKELRDPFARSQEHSARSAEQTHSPMCIGKSVVIKGELTATEDMVIYGRVEGTITVRDHTVTIGEGATIEAEITAHGVEVEGRVKGNIAASEHLEIHPGGSVIGNVNTPSLVIGDGATLKGSVDMNADRPKPKKQDESLPADGRSSPVKRDREKVSAT